MEPWRRVWRDGFVPGLSTPALEALAAGLRAEDRALIQGNTTSPLAVMCTEDWPCEGGCALSYAGWQGDGLETVGDVDLYFAKACLEADKRLGEPAACRHFLNWFDDTLRADMIPELLIEVERALAERDDPADGMELVASLPTCHSVGF